MTPRGELLDWLNQATAPAVHWRGFRLRWTGWKASHNGPPDFDLTNGPFVGQWCATRSNGPYFYSSVPGAVGRYEKGGLFDIEPQEDQEFITPAIVTAGDKDVLVLVAARCMRQAFLRLEKFMKEQGAFE